MITSNKNPIPKVIALILVTVGVAWLIKTMDASALAKMDSMSPVDYLQHEREVHSHPYIVHFIIFLIFGGFYLGLIEFIAYLIGLVIPKKPEV